MSPQVGTLLVGPTIDKVNKYTTRVLKALGFEDVEAIDENAHRKLGALLYALGFDVRGKSRYGVDLSHPYLGRPQIFITAFSRNGLGKLEGYFNIPKEVIDLIEVSYGRAPIPGVVDDEVIYQKFQRLSKILGIKIEYFEHDEGVITYHFEIPTRVPTFLEFLRKVGLSWEVLKKIVEALGGSLSLDPLMGLKVETIDQDSPIRFVEVLEEVPLNEYSLQFAIAFLGYKEEDILRKLSELERQYNVKIELEKERILDSYFNVTTGYLRVVVA